MSELTIFKEFVDKGICRIEKKIDKLEKKIDDLDGRYASKNVQRIVYGMVAIILVGTLGKVLSLI